MIKNFDTLNDFFNAANSDLHSGDIVVTSGYSAVNDGGAGEYYVISTENTNVAGLVISGKTFSKGSVQLELISDSGEVFVEQFGASSTASSAVNKAAIQAAIDSGARRINFRPTQYNVGDDILVSHPVDIVGNGAKLVFEPTSTVTDMQLFRLDYDSSENEINTATVIKDFCIEGACGNSESAVVSSIRIDCAYNVTVSDISFDGGDCAVYAKKKEFEGYNISRIEIKDCIAENMSNGFAFCTATDVKIKNCRINLVEGGVGVAVSDNSHTFIVEDLTISGGEVAVNIYDGDWNGNATERIFFKNLQVTDTFAAANISDTNLPIHFTNAMVVDVNVGVCMTRAENVTMTNSSVLSVEPSNAGEDTVPVWAVDYAKAKFIHTQFEFPLDFQRVDFDSDNSKASDLVFVDCTIQKTDIHGVDGVTSPSGFGVFGVADVDNIGVIETFDACEFRSCIKDYKLTTGEGENTVITYNFPITLSTATNSGSKLIIKNCRFINEDNSDDEQDETQGETQDETQPPKEYIPYFRLDDNAKFDNIVVYNCFFENYNYKPSEDSSVYPLFGKLTNNGLSCDVSDHNIFARCNMRSSAPDRTNGTTINEVLEYN